ncbi:MMPL family transporter [Actinocatenispora sera]|uniref:Membrane protein n=1 Tax=Actinocatenispora sera TaxID=390989 RepID=A0A810LB25_9ACTN|nr:MMPL family transporter [Actinocatenispora sera]BCJ31471.1 membrane protein [Actinocatenispora sera]
MSARRLLWWVVPALIVLLWLVGAGPQGASLGKLADVQTNDNSAFLPTSSESTEVAQQVSRFTEPGVVPAIVVYSADAPLTVAQRGVVAADAKSLGRLPGLRGPVVGPRFSEDRRAAELVVPLDSAGDVAGAVDTIRHAARDRAGLTAHVTGPAGLSADLGAAFAGIDGRLLLVTGALVFLILIVVYRSPLLPVVVLATATLALAAAGGVIYQLAKHDVLKLSGMSQGILFILVIGACTDYGLLLVARFREELHRHADRRRALTTAYRAALEPIAASGGTVILGVLCLLVTNLKSTHDVGPVAAIGIGASLLAALTFLPACLLLLGRAAFWPFAPRYGASRAPGRPGLWGRIARFVGRYPRRCWLVVGGVLLIVAVVFVPQLQASGTKQTDVFLHTEDSVTGQQVLAEHFPAGAGNPTQITARAGAADRVVAATRAVRGVSPSSVAVVGAGGRPGAGPAKVVDGRVLVEATLADAPDSAAAIDTVHRLRDRLASVPGADAKVGGFTAIQADTNATSEHDRAVVIPLVLAVVLVVLILLLRAVVAPLVLIASVVLSFAATLGVAALVFNHLLDFPGADPSVPLFAFVFLVALGVDYNIFLMSRVREESVRLGTRDGTLHALRATGGVITSAGVVLAATFAALAVLPILFLVQVAFLVAFGVLLDTIVVRSVLVPAAILDLGRASWWPSRLSRRPNPAG